MVAKKRSKGNSASATTKHVTARLPIGLISRVEEHIKSRIKATGENVYKSDVVCEALKQYLSTPKPVSKEPAQEAIRGASLPLSDPLPTEARPSEERPYIVQKAMDLASIEAKRERIAQSLAKVDAEAGAIRKEISRAVQERTIETTTAADYCLRNGLSVDTTKASALGRLASAYCRTHGLEIGQAPHPHYGSVNAYPVEAMEYAVSQQGGVS